MLEKLFSKRVKVATTYSPDFDDENDFYYWIIIDFIPWWFLSSPTYVIQNIETWELSQESLSDILVI